jgi:exodeoxyribonuclease-3
VRIATWNVNSLRVRLEQLARWDASARCDVIALQETKCTDAQFPRAELEALGFECVHSGQPTYNGVALLSRRGAPTDVVSELPGAPDPQRRLLAATVAGVRVVCVYCPNGQAVGSEKYGYKLEWFARLRALLVDELARHRELVLLGDFNVAPEDRDVHDPAAWAGQVLCSAPERAALGALAALGLEDCFRRFEQPARSFSWWDYRAAGFRRDAGLRIDLILASGALAARCRACTIDRQPRGWERPSDHAPVHADFAPAE